jgi:hypothetical protein
MKSIITCFMVFLLMGCSTTVPVTMKFPDAPLMLKQKCGPLKLLAEDAKLSDIAKNVTENYNMYYSCAVKMDAWIEWHEKQQKIFEVLP